MENKIKIIQAISQCNANTGKPIKEIRLILGAKLRPNSSIDAGRQCIYSFDVGTTKSITLEQVQIICEVTGCDANFLFGIN